jgi:hypothetical protein
MKGFFIVTAVLLVSTLGLKASRLCWGDGGEDACCSSTDNNDFLCCDFTKPDGNRTVCVTVTSSARFQRLTFSALLKYVGNGDFTLSTSMSALNSTYAIVDWSVQAKCASIRDTVQFWRTAGDSNLEHMKV